MKRWAGAMILVPAALLLAAIGIYWQTQAHQGGQAWGLPIMGSTIFVALAIYVSHVVSRVGRAILFTIALVLDGLLGLVLWALLIPHEVA
jgi:hypothetical protein